jgi:hypothetical protein
MKKFGKVITEEEIKRRTSPVWPYVYFKPGVPVKEERVDACMKGAIDVHLHGAPLGAWLAGRPKMTDTAIEASRTGMKALVFKDHNTMTNNIASVIQDFLEKMKKYEEGFTPVEVYGGIVLNETVGGLNPHAVEVALEYGRCKEIWMPSLDSEHQRKAMGKKGGINITKNGELRPEAKEIVDIVEDYNNKPGDRCAISACHISNEEKMVLLNYTKSKNVDVLIDHVTQELTIVTPEEAKEMIDKGGYLEFAECSCIPWPGMNDWVIAFDYSFDLLKELIKTKGPDHLVLITDAGQPGNLPVPGLKQFVKILLAQGIKDQDINLMLKKVPAKILGIK